MKEVISTEKAPGAIGPYSQAIKFDNIIFFSGQVALDPESGELVSDDVSEQTRMALRNLGEVLNAAGATFDDVVKTTVFLSDMADFGAMNDVYGKIFVEDPPARATVAAAGLPKGAKVEIECVAVVK